MKYIAYEVGKPISGIPAGIHFDIADDGAYLIISINRPTAKEKQAYSHGLFQMKYVVIDGMIFTLFRFGTLPWMDSPFNREFSKASIIKRPDDGMGLSLHIMLVDSATSILVAERIIGLHTKFSNDFIDAIQKQPLMTDQYAYSIKLNKLYNQFTTDQMVDIATHEN